MFFRRVNHRAHQLKISFHHEAPAYLDQDYPITIEVTNIDIRDLGVVVNILLQPTEIDDAGTLVILLVVVVIQRFSYSELGCGRRKPIFQSHQGRTVRHACARRHSSQDSTFV